MHGPGVALTSASGNVKMAYGCQWESRLLITELQMSLMAQQDVLDEAFKNHYFQRVK
jgi:hypothetical protein